MSKGKLLLSGIIGFITIHLGLVILGVVLGTMMTLPFIDHGGEALQCQEDEVAIHGGLSDWYDADLPLECVNFDEFPEAHVHTPAIEKVWCKEPGGRLETCAVGPETTVPNPTPTPTPVPTPTPTPTPVPQTMNVALTFYTCPPFCPGDTMANGQPLGVGDVACGYALSTGQRFVFNGAEYMCEDRGGGPYYWVDFWQPTYEIGMAWQAEVGTIGEIILLEG